jgi:ATP-dependent RNA helicase DDX42
MKATNLQRVTFVVLDEADRILDLGFEAQVRSICQNVRPDRQTLMFSATFKKETESLAMELIVNPVKISVGDTSFGSGLTLNEKIEHWIEFLQEDKDKWTWISENLPGYIEVIEGTIIIFVSRKEGVQQLALNLDTHAGIQSLCLHGDMLQDERQGILSQFKDQKRKVLVATDLAARGLDVAHVRLVINYDPPRDMEGFVHRIGRTGRLSQITSAWERDLAISLVTQLDSKFAYGLVKLLAPAIIKSKGAIKCRGLEKIKELADKESNKRAVKNKGFKRQVTRAGIGFKQVSAPKPPKNNNSKKGNISFVRAK